MLDRQARRDVGPVGWERCWTGRLGEMLDRQARRDVGPVG